MTVKRAIQVEERSAVPKQTSDRQRVRGEIFSFSIPAGVTIDMYFWKKTVRTEWSYRWQVKTGQQLFVSGEEKLKERIDGYDT